MSLHHLDRVLEGNLRAGEILFSMAWAEMEYIGSDKTELASKCMTSLVQARKALSLFQHHDGITATAKDHVVLDYGDKMVNSINMLQKVISQATNFLLTKSKANYNQTCKQLILILNSAEQQPGPSPPRR